MVLIVHLPRTSFIVHGPLDIYIFFSRTWPCPPRYTNQMIHDDFWSRLAREIKNLLPLFRYLILQTETHAFCLALAGAALVGFFPACLVMLAVFKNLLRWEGAYDVLLNTVGTYFPV